MTEDGTDEIISTRSKTYQKLNVDIDALPLQDLYSIIQDNPGLLRRPIILDDKRLQVGYNEDEIRRFYLEKCVRSNYKKRNVWLTNQHITNQRLSHKVALHSVALWFLLYHNR